MTRSQEGGKLWGEEFQAPSSQCRGPEARKSLTHLRTKGPAGPGGQAEEADREQTRQSPAEQGKGFGLFPSAEKPGRVLSRWKAEVLSQRT